MVIVPVVHPGLNAFVVPLPRPFPEITEEPGYPLPEAFTETFQHQLDYTKERFSKTTVPLVIRLADHDSVTATVQDPSEIHAQAHRNSSGAYDGLSISMRGSNVQPFSKSASYFGPSLDRTDEWDRRPTFERFHDQNVFGKVVLDLDSEEGLLQGQTKIASFFGDLVVGREVAELDLTAGQRQHLYWFSVLLKGYYSQDGKPVDLLSARHRLSSRPSLGELEDFRDRFTPGIPDPKSQELLTYLFALSRMVNNIREPERQLIGENFNLITSD